MLRSIKRVGFVVNEHKADAPALVKQLGQLLEARRVEFFGEAANAAALGLLPALDERAFREADLCVVLGGDGTLLRAARLLGDSEVPMFGVHLGSLGFMMETAIDEAPALLARALDGGCEVQPRLKLAVRVFGGDGAGRVEAAPRLEARVLNEVVVTKGALSRIVELETWIDGLSVTCFRADGVIISTPTGSTGYSLSAAGPILAPGLSAIAVTPICPHTLAQRPLVVPGTSHIELTLEPGSSEVFLTLDGQRGQPLEPFDRIRIEAAAARALLVRNPRLDFFSILRTRLGWGGGR